MSQFSTILFVACALGVVAALNYSPEDYPKKAGDKESNATKPHHVHKPHVHKTHHNSHAKPCATQQDQHHHFNQHQAPHHMHHHGPPAIHYHYHYETAACGCQQQQSCKPHGPKPHKPEPSSTHAPTHAPTEEPLIITTEEPAIITTPETSTTSTEKVTERVARFTPVAPIELHQKASAFFKDPARAEYNSRQFDRDH